MPITVRIPEACRLTGIGRSKLYELIAAGEIEIIKVGTITLVPVVSLTNFLQRYGGKPVSLWPMRRWQSPKAAEPEGRYPLSHIPRS
jgi:excisionase family DNA binding protein